jgi:hypothetical protein
MRATCQCRFHIAIAALAEKSGFVALTATLATAPSAAFI